MWNLGTAIPSGGLELPLLLTFSCPEEWVRNKMKDFINDFYTMNDHSSDESDIEIDLELTEKEDDKEEVEASAPIFDDEMTSILLLQDTTCIVIGDN